MRLTQNRESEFKRLLHTDNPYHDSLAPAQAKYLHAISRAHGLGFDDLDNGSGYLIELSSGTKAIVIGGGVVCAYPINSATAHGIARDKKHTKSVLSRSGIPVIPGRLFFLSNRYHRLLPPNSTIADSVEYAKECGFPVFAKPNDGARGDFAEIIYSPADLDAYAERIRGSYKAFLIEKYIAADEYRVFVKDGEPLFSYLKEVVALEGDGVSTAGSLLAEKNQGLDGFGISPIPIQLLEALGVDRNEVLPKGTKLPLPGRQNTSVDGGWQNFTCDVGGDIARIAIESCAALGLRLGAVDIFAQHVTDGECNHCVIEVNSNPNITVLEKSDNHAIIYKIWTDILRELFS